MPRNYFYIVNRTLGGVLSNASDLEGGTNRALLKWKITPEDNTQLWYMDSTSNAYIQNVGSNLVLERQLIGPNTADYWVSAVPANGHPLQLWSYNVGDDLIENSEGGKLDIMYGIYYIICSPSTITGETPRELTTPESPAAVDVAADDNYYYWQLQIAGQFNEEPD